MCLRLLVLAALLQLALSQDALPPSPCPEVYEYERDPNTREWRGLISMLTPARYSDVKVEVVLSSSVPVAQDEVGDVAVRGGQKGAMEATRAVLANRRHVLQYVVIFPIGKPVPSLLKVIINGREFCNAGRVPSNSRSQITLQSFLSTGVNAPQSNGQDFDLVSKSPTRPPLPPQEPDFGEQFPDLVPSEEPPTFQPKPPPKPRPTTTSTTTTTATPEFGVDPEEDFEVDLATCGYPTSRPNQLVVNGYQAVRGQWPWQTALFKIDDNGKDGPGIRFQCGGTLVTRRHVITAAHCVVERKSNRQKVLSTSSLVIYLGRHSLKSFTEKHLQTMEADKINVHPMFNENLAHDLAVILLTSAAQMTDFVKPICLWTGSTDLAPIVDKVASVAGWGYDDTGKISDFLRTAPMPIISQETCFRSDIFYTKYTSEFTLCAGFKNGTTVCNGDSGGGLVLPMNNAQQRRSTWFLRGVVSVSMLESGVNTVCSLYNYVVFTDVAKYLPWIHEQFKKRPS